MQLPLQITYRDMDPSDAIEAEVRKRAQKLESLYDRIMGCRVVIEAPHRHHQNGRLFSIRLDLTVPGTELVVNRDPQQDPAHEDVMVAIRDAFNAIESQLRSWVDRRR